MKTALTILLTFTLTNLLFSQEEENYVQFGFGVSLSSESNIYNNYYGYGEESLQIETLPINMANISMIIKDNDFRIEPSLGYFTTSSGHSDGASTSENSISNIRIGT
ncbi:MAG TPA: hypothetical protein VIY47_10780, partial [Ignavibacteriaceae bacterium]